jgi:hypothetical protein
MSDSKNAAGNPLRKVNSMFDATIEVLHRKKTKNLSKATSFMFQPCSEFKKRSDMLNRTQNFRVRNNSDEFNRLDRSEIIDTSPKKNSRFIKAIGTIFTKKFIPEFPDPLVTSQAAKSRSRNSLRKNLNRRQRAESFCQKPEARYSSNPSLRQTINPKIFRKIKDDEPEFKIHGSQTMVFPKYQNNAKSGGLGDSPGRKARPSNLLKTYFQSPQDQTVHQCKEFSM